MKILRWLLIGMCIVLGTLVALWAAGALYYDLPAPGPVRTGAAILWLVGAGIAATFAIVKHKPLAFAGLGAAFLLLLAWWISLKPSQDRDWKAEVAVLPYAEVQGDIITLHNIRNFEYRSTTDFTPRYETRTLDLKELRGIDLFINYWGSEFMAHPLVSFDFGPQGRVAFSIETRPEKGESYSAIGGFYRQFELIVIPAEERDVVRLRTNYRKEEVFLYRLQFSPEHARERFMEYVASMNALKAKPMWYNALTHNCTTTIRAQRDAALRTEWDWRMLANGYMDQMLYEQGALDNSLPFSELRQQAHVDPGEAASDDAETFSRDIRAHLKPWPEQPLEKP